MFNFLKNAVLSVVKIIVALFLVIFLCGVFSALFGTDDKSSRSASYVEGYLREGALWQDGKDNFYKNDRQVKVEIWSRELVTSRGEKLTQIYFLEGVNAGTWGYVNKNCLKQ